MKIKHAPPPPSLSAAGKIHLGTKSDLLVCLGGVFEAQSEAPKVSSVVIDGATAVQMLKPGSAQTFDQYAHQVFLPYYLEIVNGIESILIEFANGNTYIGTSLS